MFVAEVGTISAAIFTLVVMLLGQSVAGKHIRQAYDPVATGTVHHPDDTKSEPQDWPLLRSSSSSPLSVMKLPTPSSTQMHPDFDVKDTIRSLQTTVTSCDVPGEGMIVSSWIGGSCDQSTYNDCCGPLMNFTTCTTYKRYPGKWNGGFCSGYKGSECCVEENGYTLLTFETCDEPDEQIPGAWMDGTCTELSLSDCCGSLRNFTTCDTYKRWPGKWGGGVCSGYEQSDCCFEENGYTALTFETCDEPDDQLPGKWGPADTCLAFSLSDCCGPLLNFTTCDANERWPGKWSGGVCSALVESDCCIVETGYTVFTFESCDEPDGQLPGAWVIGTCTALSLSVCCGPISGSESSSGGLIIGIVVPLLIVVLVTLISCARGPCCPLYSKMNCSFKNQPVPAAPGSNEPSEASSKMEKFSNVLTSGGKIFHTVSNIPSTVESLTASVNNTTQFVANARAVEQEKVEC
jgi:hypothetical protein